MIHLKTVSLSLASLRRCEEGGSNTGNRDELSTYQTYFTCVLIKKLCALLFIILRLGIIYYAVNEVMIEVSVSGSQPSVQASLSLMKEYGQLDQILAAQSSLMSFAQIQERTDVGQIVVESTVVFAVAVILHEPLPPLVLHFLAMTLYYNLQFIVQWYSFRPKRKDM